MQLANSGCKWCDFIVYTFKGLVIERIYFDQNHSENLVSKINYFYFNHLLSSLAKNLLLNVHSIKTMANLRLRSLTKFLI